MRFIIDNEDTGTLEVHVGNRKEKITFGGLNLDYIYQWYPMNTSYIYRYQKPRDRLYLYPETSPPENVDYGYKERKRTRPAEVVIEDIKPDMVCLNVFIDNVKLMKKAESLELPNMINHNYSSEEVKDGIKTLLSMDTAIRDILETRVMEQMELREFREMQRDEREEVLYSHATEEESEEINTIGKLYTMLNLMRKIAEVKGR